jgi:hypothetical protein
MKKRFKQQLGLGQLPVEIKNYSIMKLIKNSILVFVLLLILLYQIQFKEQFFSFFTPSLKGES